MAAPTCVNPTLYNAALGGMVAGLNFQRANTGLTTTYDAQVAAAKVFATNLDGTITALANLSAGNATIAATTAAITDCAGSRPALMFSLCMAYWSNKCLNGTSTDTTSATYDTAVAAIKAQWTAILTETSSA